MAGNKPAAGSDIFDIQYASEWSLCLSPHRVYFHWATRRHAASKKSQKSLHRLLPRRCSDPRMKFPNFSPILTFADFLGYGGTISRSGTSLGSMSILAGRKMGWEFKFP